MPDSVTLRPSGDGDAEFLFRVYAAARAGEIATTGWDDQMQEAFLRQQFEAQTRHYRLHYPNADFLVIEERGIPIGRFYVARLADEIRLIDIALLPEFQQRRIGTRLVRDLLTEGAAAGKPVRLHVERFNPAARLYERLGFRVIEDGEVYLLLECGGRPH
jgi:ribosomal protein S18 acetylase RimI-like enzyme